MAGRTSDPLASPGGCYGVQVLIAGQRKPWRDEVIGQIRRAGFRATSCDSGVDALTVLVLVGIRFADQPVKGELLTYDRDRATLDEAVATARTGDVWVFRGRSVADRAIQSFGGMGVSADTPVAAAMLNARYLRIADGPDEVHLSQLGKQKIAEYASGNQQR